jgi:hypothetical protein
MSKPKRVVVISDLQCGHVVGLTPPGWQLKPVDAKGKRTKHIRIQQALWKEYRAMCDAIGYVDVLIVNGDCIDGRSDKTGGTETITADRDEQCEIACECIRRINYDKLVMVYGTGYHVSSDGEDFENQIAAELKADKIGSHEWISVNGCIFDCKHFVGNSTVPHGRATALWRDQVWNALWALRNEQPLGDVMVRSHVHAYLHIETADFEAATTPALQGMGSKFGSRICSGTVDFGMIGWDVKSKHEKKLFSHIVKIPEQAAKVTLL